MDNAEFFEALKLLQKEKGIEGDYLLEKDVYKRQGQGSPPVPPPRSGQRDCWPSGPRPPLSLIHI